MKTGDIARRLGVSPKAIRDWISEFDAYFNESPTKQRVYSEEDYIVLATIAKFSHQGYGYASIHEKLKDGERVDVSEDITYGIDTRMIPAASVEQMMDATEVRLQLERVTTERDRLVEMVEDLQHQVEQKLDSQKQEYETKLDRQRDDYERKQDSLQKEIRVLLERVGRAEAQAEMLKDLLKKGD